MNGWVYTRTELRRALRARRFFILSLVFPPVLYFVIAGPNRHVTDFNGSGISVPVYYMVSLASFGTMLAMLSSGGRIAGERQAGWTRQLRITPLSVRAYFRAKVLTSYLLASISLLLLYLSGAVLGVSLPLHVWLAMTGLILVGLLPFAALGIALGHVLTVESVAPTTGGTVALLAVLSGTWFPITHGFLHDLGQWLPSYWLVRAAAVALGGSGWGAMGWAVIAGWTIVLSTLAAVAYRRDTRRL